MVQWRYSHGVEQVGSSLAALERLKHTEHHHQYTLAEERLGEDVSGSTWTLAGGREQPENRPVFPGGVVAAVQEQGQPNVTFNSCFPKLPFSVV